jgi:peptide/nickel transport system ATP-binding protein
MTQTMTQRTTDTPVLSVTDLSVTFRSRHGDVPALRNVSFDVAAGETVGLVGESGSGKSLTSAAIMGLLPRNAVSCSDSARASFAHCAASVLPWWRKTR